MIDHPPVSVIIPTQGKKVRANLLWRALESALSQEGVVTEPLVVVNGQETDPAVEARLRAYPRVRTIRLEDAGLPISLRAGRMAVETPWFTELDDDDAFLPGALATRVRALRADPEADVVVSNGYREDGRDRVLHVERMEDVARDPLRALTRQNWLLPGAWLCRTETVGESLFQDMPDYLECTYMAIQFATRYRSLFMQEPTVIWRTDTPESASKSPAYVLSAPKGLTRILEMDLPKDVRHSYRLRMAQALHDVADWHRGVGALGEAWRHHLASLVQPGGIRYLPYTARLLLRPFPPRA